MREHVTIQTSNPLTRKQATLAARLAQSLHDRLAQHYPEGLAGHLRAGYVKEAWQAWQQAKRNLVGVKNGDRVYFPKLGTIYADGGM